MGLLGANPSAEMRAATIDKIDASLAHASVTASSPSVKVSLAHFYWWTQDNDHWEQGIKLANDALQMDSKAADGALSAHRALQMLYRSKAYRLCVEGRHEESFPLWQLAIDHSSDPIEQDFTRTERSLELAKIGRFVEALSEADEIASRNAMASQHYPHLARVYAVAFEKAKNDESLVNGRTEVLDHCLAACVESLRKSELRFLSKPGAVEFEVDDDFHFKTICKEAAFIAWRQSFAKRQGP